MRRICWLFFLPRPLTANRIFVTHCVHWAALDCAGHRKPADDPVLFEPNDLQIMQACLKQSGPRRASRSSHIRTAFLPREKEYEEPGSRLFRMCVICHICLWA